MKSLFLLPTFILIFNFTNKAQTWEILQNQNGIQIYFRSSGENLIEIKATQILKTNTLTVASVLLDFDNYINWKSSCILSKKNGLISENKYVYYYQSEVPWPFSDRDCVLKFTIDQNKRTGVIKTKAIGIKGYKALNNNFERDYGNQNNWILTPLSKNKVKITNYISFKISEAYPVWLIKQAINEGYYETMINLRTQIKLPTHINTKLSLLKN